ncbi:CCR4-NOT transcription complex subunit 4-like protein [Drosera capensis]
MLLLFIGRRSAHCECISLLPRFTSIPTIPIDAVFDFDSVASRIVDFGPDLECFWWFLGFEIRATMSDEGEKLCPLCAEEMDLTDQQLKPCKCGYEICVWCWHHIMDMAEKDDTEGRCPACRTPYDKEKIVGMAAKCERLASEISMERRKSQKAKSKATEARKHLTSVRVIQRNLVYIVGLPLNLAEEDLLQRNEYFGQYGKVLKVSISRTSGGSVQQFPNSTCCVYTTYTKEEEAVRCIQSVHGFILEGRSLRACFGTTKYCHAWLKNGACNNPDCLYLHEVGPQDDSFSKDEIISSYTSLMVLLSSRRPQQITAGVNNMPRRSGSVLPPPSDDYCSNSSAPSAKPAVKGATNTPVTAVRASTPPSSSCRTGALPPAASWAAHSLNVQSAGGSVFFANGPSKHNSEPSGSGAISSIVPGNTQTSVVGVGKQPLRLEESGLRQPNSKLESVEPLQFHNGTNPGKNVSDVSVTPSAPVPVVSAGLLHNTIFGTSDISKGIGVSSSGPPSIDEHFDLSCVEKDNTIHDAQPQKFSADASSVSAEKQVKVDDFKSRQRNGFNWDMPLLTGNHGLRLGDVKKFDERLVEPVVKASTFAGELNNTSSDGLDWRSDVIPPAVQNMFSGTLETPGIQMPVDASSSSSLTLAKSSSGSLLSNQFASTLQHANANDAVNYNSNLLLVDKNASTSFGTTVEESAASVLSNGHLEIFISSSYMDDRLSNEGRGIQRGRFDGHVATADPNHNLDIESRIISNILSLDLDGWDESLTSPHNVAKLLGEPDKPHATFGIPSSQKVQNSNQSRFSFARQDEARKPLFDAVQSVNISGEGSLRNSLSQPYSENRETYVPSLGTDLGLQQHVTPQSDNFFSSQPGFSSTTKSPISAPPGFSMPSRLPPPGFSSHDRNALIMDFKSGVHSPDASSLLRNTYQISSGANTSGHGDIEFLDPAILAVGNGRHSNGMNNLGFDLRSIFPAQSAASVNVQPLMHSSLASHQNPRYGNVTDGFAMPNDAYAFASRHIEQSAARNICPLSQLSLHQPRNSVMSNGHWDAWSELQTGNDIAETLRNERQGYKLYGGYEDPKFQMPNSANLYNRSFGM